MVKKLQCQEPVLLYLQSGSRKRARKAGALLSFSYFTQPELQPLEWCCPQSGCVFLSSSTFLEAIFRLVPRSKSPWCLTLDPIKLSMSTEHHNRRTERGRRKGEKERGRRVGESPRAWAGLLQEQEGSLEFSPPLTRDACHLQVCWEPARQPWGRLGKSQQTCEQ